MSFPKGMRFSESKSLEYSDSQVPSILVKAEDSPRKKRPSALPGLKESKTNLNGSLSGSLDIIISPKNDENRV